MSREFQLAVFLMLSKLNWIKKVDLISLSESGSKFTLSASWELDYKFPKIDTLICIIRRTGN
jgi:hypothetical protein